MKVGGGEECKECRVRYGRSLTCIGGEGQNIKHWKNSNRLEWGQAKQCKVWNVECKV